MPMYVLEQSAPAADGRMFHSRRVIHPGSWKLPMRSFEKNTIWKDFTGRIDPLPANDALFVDQKI